MEIRGLIKNLIMAILDLVCVMQSGILQLEKSGININWYVLLKACSIHQGGVNGLESTIRADLVEVFCDFADNLLIEWLEVFESWIWYI